MSKIVSIPAPANLAKKKVPEYNVATSPVASRYAAARIKESFNWDQSAEGGPFWLAVYERLSQIARDGIIKEL